MATSQTGKKEVDAASEPLRDSVLLLVDDEANILASLRRLFRPDGYRVLTAEGGAAGLAILEREPVDLVISDMRMPEMTGAQFLQQVAERWPDVIRILLTGYADLNSTVEAINKGHIYSYFSKPWEDNEIRLAVRHALEQKVLEEERRRLEELTRRQNAELKELNATLEEKVAARTEELRQTNLFLELAYEQLEQSYYAAIPIFANLVELREGPGGGHGRDVAELARRIAEGLGLDEETARQVYFAGLLHDIGKIGLPDRMLRTPYADLKPMERQVVDKHPVTGQAILMGLEPLQTTALFIRHHHERPDGYGFPDRLEGDAIPLGSRIVAVASDYYDLLSGALFGEKSRPRQAVQFILERRGARYDAAVVDQFVSLVEQDEREAAAQEVALAPHALRPGMVLARDLVNGEGILLLTRGYRLNEHLIAKLHDYAQDQEEPVLIHVRPPEAEEAEPEARR